MFKHKWEMPPSVVILLVIGVALLVLLPGLKLGPLGDAVGGAIAVTVAFAMGRRVEESQARRRALEAEAK